MKKAVSLLASFIVFGASAVQAKEEADTLDEVVIWGTTVKSSSVYMGNEDLDIKQADHISDLLRTIPGVDVGGAHSLNQRITIRSIEDKDIDISIDGANQNNYMYHHMGNLQIHADILRAVDIDVGTNSVLHGGLGGSVRFETKSAMDLLKGSGQFGVLGKATASTNASDDVALSLFGEKDGLDVLAYYNHVEKKNFEVGGGEIKDADGNLIAGTDGKVRGLKGKVDSSLIKAGFQVAEHQRLELGYQYYKDEGNYSYRPDMGLATDIAIGDSTGTPLLWPTEYTRDTTTLNYDGSIGDTTIRAVVYDNSSSLWRDETGYAESTIPRFQGWAAFVKGTAGNYGLNLIATTSVDVGIKHQLTYGGEAVRYDTDYQANYTSGAVDSSDEDKTDYSVYIEDRLTIGDVFSVTPGIRVDNVDIESVVVDNHFTQTSMALALEYQPSNAWVVRLSSTELFQAPELSEVFVGAGLFDTANQDIKAETGLNSELAFAYGDRVLGADRFSLGATVFQTKINDYIYDYAAPDASNPRDTWKDNIGDAKIKGFEAYVGYDIGDLSTLLTYSANDSKIASNEFYGQYDGARLDRVQGDTISFELDYHLTAMNLQLHWDFQIVDDLDPVDSNLQLDGAGSDNSKGGYTVHNISAQWQPLSMVSFIFGIDNVFDEYYVSQSSRTGSTFHPVFGSLYLNDYEPGRNIKATVSYQF